MSPFVDVYAALRVKKRLSKKRSIIQTFFPYPFMPPFGIAGLVLKSGTERIQHRPSQIKVLVGRVIAVVINMLRLPHLLTGDNLGCQQL